MWPWWQVTMWGHTVVCSNGTQASRAGHTLILTTLVIFVTTGTTLNQACGYNQICSCQSQNSSESVIFTEIQTHCSAVCCGGTWIGDTNHTPGLYPPHAALQQQFSTSIPIIATSNIKIFVICSNIKIFDHTWRYKYTQSLFPKSGLMTLLTGAQYLTKYQWGQCYCRVLAVLCLEHWSTVWLSSLDLPAQLLGDQISRRPLFQMDSWHN